MDGDAEFKQLLSQLSDLFDAYIQVDEYIFNQKLGQQIDYAPWLEQLGRIAEGLRLLTDNLETYIEDEDVRMTQLYMGRLFDAVAMLDAMVSKLAVQAGGRGKYSGLQYRRDLKAYRKAVSGYTKVGSVMNQVMQRY